MKKLVLFAAIVVTVAFSACKKNADVTPQDNGVEAVPTTTNVDSSAVDSGVQQIDSAAVDTTKTIAQ